VSDREPTASPGARCPVPGLYRCGWPPPEAGAERDTLGAEPPRDPLGAETPRDTLGAETPREGAATPGLYPASTAQ